MNAWDCGTGNGQVARALASRFEKVYASDISIQQLTHASIYENIRYVCEPSEDCAAPDFYFDLIVVAQAIHWFNFDAFYSQVYRTLKPDGLFACWTYENIQTEPEIEALVRYFYNEIVGPFWDPERKLIEEKLTTIPFPFKEIACPGFQITDFWSSQRMIDYLNSWSACRHYFAAKGIHAVDLISQQLLELWPEHEIKEVTFPIYMRMGNRLIQ